MLKWVEAAANRGKSRGWASCDSGPVLVNRIIADTHAQKKKEHVMDLVESEWRPDLRFALNQPGSFWAVRPSHFTHVIQPVEIVANSIKVAPNLVLAEFCCDAAALREQLNPVHHPVW
jgi:hypothetical protein